MGTLYFVVDLVCFEILCGKSEKPACNNSTFKMKNKYLNLSTIQNYWFRFKRF